VRAKTGRILHTANPSDVPLAKIPPMLKLTLQKRVRMMQRAYRRQLKERGAGRPPALAAGRDEPPPVPPARSVLCASDSK
jgi:hypothetical protein